jgi:threonine/homoserine/homoserine lactone efflux protein
VHVVLFALVAATSPLALASVLVVLTSGRGRLNGIAFAIGFVFGQAAFCVLALVLGTLSVPDASDRIPVLKALATLALGLALLAAAAYVRRRRSVPTRPEPNTRTEAFRRRLATLRPPTALGTGFLLGIGGPKRIGLTLIVTATITASALGSAYETTLAIVYVLLATVLVWVPVLLYVAFGQRAADWLTRVQTWITAHSEPLTFYPSAVLGVVLVVDGIVQVV